ncbi:hypothetical protein REPUB_Repub07fG0115100 [Reevesia pubescens]
MAKKMIEEMQMKNGNASQIKEQIVVLEEQLSRFTTNETSARDALIKNRLEVVKNIELQEVKMRRRNKELELEKRELLVKLYAADAKISSLSDMTESKTIAKISELRHVNGEHSKEVERLQKSRFDMVEELVYQRRLKACLRAEIQYHQTSSRKTFQKELQKASDRKQCKITTQCADLNNNSSYSSSADSEEIDGSTIESSSSSQRSISKNSGTGNRTSWRRSMDSTSSKTSVSLPKDFTETTEMQNLTKVRRVSFNDSVETVPKAKLVKTKSVERVFDHKEMVTWVSGHRSRMKAGLQSQSEVSLAKPDQSSDSNKRSVDEDGRDAQEVSWIANARPEGPHSSISNVVPNENKMDTHIKPPVFAFFLFLFVLLDSFLHLSASIY